MKRLTPADFGYDGMPSDAMDRIHNAAAAAGSILPKKQREPISTRRKIVSNPLPPEKRDGVLWGRAARWSRPVAADHARTFFEERARKRRAREAAYYAEMRERLGQTALPELAHV